MVDPVSKQTTPYDPQHLEEPTAMMNDPAKTISR